MTTPPHEDQMAATRTPPVNGSEQKFLTIPLPPIKLQQACEGWLKIAAVLRSHEQKEKQAATCNSITEESRFLLGEESCCEICFAVMQCVTKDAFTTAPFGEPIYVGAGAGVFSFDYLAVKVWGPNKAYRFVLPPGMVSPWEKFFTRAPQGKSVMDKIRRLVSRCDALHSCFDITADNLPALPTRVIDISQGPEQICLRDGAQHIRDRYVCLSHCWGSKQPLQTTTKNISENQQNIPWDRFPVVYKEAIQISWELEVKYLWIDSLCIIQDSVVDWVRESQNMRNVYAGSYLTVAATSSADCSFSMLEPLSSGGPSEEQKRTTECRILDRDEQVIHSLICTAEGEHGYWDGFTAPFHDIYAAMPLLSRAWTYQEQLLSCRLVHLTRMELVWQCKRGVLCDCSAATYSGEEFDLPFYRVMEETTSRTADAESSQKDSKNQQQTQYEHEDEKDEMAFLWRSIVMRYSKRQLTFDKDKLPALSGLAHMVSRKRSPEARYLAGLWGDSLLLDLLWHRRIQFQKYDKKVERRSRECWVAPTFSWASTRAEVAFPIHVGYDSMEDYPAVKGTLEKGYVEILDAHCEPATLDPMGQVRSGFLKVKARAVHGRVIKVSGNSFGEIILDDQDELWDVAEEDRRVRGFIADVEKDGLWIEAGTTGGMPSQVEVPVVCVPWARVCRVKVDEDWSPPHYTGEEWAIVLHSADDQKSDITESRVFNRVGVLRGRAVKGEFGTREEYLARWGTKPGLFEERGQEVHTFTIL